MPTALIRTMGSLRTDGLGHSLAGLLMAAILRGGWRAWLLRLRGASSSPAHCAGPNGRPDQARSLFQSDFIPAASFGGPVLQRMIHQDFAPSGWPRRQKRGTIAALHARLID